MFVRKCIAEVASGDMLYSDPQVYSYRCGYN